MSQKGEVKSDIFFLILRSGINKFKVGFFVCLFFQDRELIGIGQHS